MRTLDSPSINRCSRRGLLMGRRWKVEFPLADGRVVGATPKIRGGLLRATFALPDGERSEVSTGVPVPKGWTPAKNPPGAWYHATAKLIVQAWAAAMPADLRKGSWNEAAAALSRLAVRPRTIETYLAALTDLADSVGLKGPWEVTPQLAQKHITDFRLTPYKRGHASDAPQRMRSPQTVHNRVKNLSMVWSNLADLGFVNSNPWQSVKKPMLPKRLPSVPSEAAFAHLLSWIEERFKGWPLLTAFVRLKMVTGRRLFDLCQVRSEQLKGDVLTIRHDQDKTGQELAFPLPADLAAVLHAVKGPIWMWEKYAPESRLYNPGSRNIKTFAPSSMYHAVKAIFRKHNKRHPEHKVKTHDLRKRAITLISMATGDVDATAAALGLNPLTARTHYLDTKKAFSGADLMRRMASVLLPPK